MSRLSPEGVVLKDGTALPAQVVVHCTPPTRSYTVFDPELQVGRQKGERPQELIHKCTVRTRNLQFLILGLHLPSLTRSCRWGGKRETVRQRTDTTAVPFLCKLEVVTHHWGWSHKLLLGTLATSNSFLTFQA